MGNNGMLRSYIFFLVGKPVSLGILIVFGLGKINLLLNIGCVSVSDESWLDIFQVIDFFSKMPISHLGVPVIRPTVIWPTVIWPTIIWPTVIWPCVNWPYCNLAPSYINALILMNHEPYQTRTFVMISVIWWKFWKNSQKSAEIIFWDKQTPICVLWHWH